MSNQRLMKVKEKAGDGYAKTNAIGGGVEATATGRERLQGPSGNAVSKQS